MQIAQDGFSRSRKKTQPYRGTARLSDADIGKPDKQYAIAKSCMLTWPMCATTGNWRTSLYSTTKRMTSAIGLQRLLQRSNDIALNNEPLWTLLNNHTLGEGSKGFIVLLYQIYEFEKPASYRGFMGIQPGLLGLSASGLYMKTALSQTEVLC